MAHTWIDGELINASKLNAYAEDIVAGVSPTVSISKVGKVTTITITDIDGVHTATINDGNDGQGTGDMLKATYDPDNKQSQIATEEELTTHTGDTNVHTTSLEKTTWNGKENAGKITIGGTEYEVRTGTSGASGYITIEVE